MIKVLFVCLGNICRSPTADGVFRKLVEDAGLSHRIEVDSAGTAAYHIGNPPDSRTVRAAAQRGYDLSDLRARKVKTTDFDFYDYILAMDNENFYNLRAVAKGNDENVEMFLTYQANDSGYSEVPDPYYEGEEGFSLVLDLVEDAAQGLLDSIKKKHNL